jgi:hypothetical protein
MPKHNDNEEMIKEIVLAQRLHERDSIISGISPMIDILLSGEMPRHMFEAWLGDHVRNLMEMAIRYGDDHINGPVEGRSEEVAVQDAAVREVMRRICS